MSDVNERIRIFLKQEEEKLDRLRSMVGPLFSQESFEEAVKKYSDACNAQIQLMIDEDVQTQNRRNNEAYQARQCEQSPSGAGRSSSSATWNLSNPIVPHVVSKASDALNSYNAAKVPCPYLHCNRVCGNPGSYYRHKQMHEENGDLIDPKKRDYVNLKDRADFGIKSEPDYELHFDPSAHEDKSSEERDSPVERVTTDPKTDYSSGKKRKGIEAEDNRNDGDSMSDVSDNERVLGPSSRGFVGGDKPKRKMAEKRAQYSVLFKMQAIQKYDEFVAAGVTVELQATVAKHFGINQSSICRWVRQRKEIAAAFQTAEADRMRVTMTFKRRNAELTGKYDDYGDDSSAVAAAFGLTGPGGIGGGIGAKSYEPTNMLPAYALAPTVSASSYGGFYPNVGMGSSSSSGGGGMGVGTLPSLSGGGGGSYAGNYLPPPMLSQYPPLSQQQQQHQQSLSSLPPPPGSYGSYGSGGYYPSSSSSSSGAAASMMPLPGYNAGVSSALSLNDSSVFSSSSSGLGINTSGMPVMLSSQLSRSPQPRSPP